MLPAELKTDYAGQKAPLFGLALRTGLLTVLTLGFYRFWMKTRIRRYYWSSIRPGGAPLEYVGTATEKLQGFLTAVVVLAFYIGVVNLVLMFFSFSLFQGGAPAYALSFVGLVPIYFFAQYRARRYLLARTRWRGIRFGLEPGVAGYVWRAFVHWAITILTLGILWPRMTFALEKYRTDRTFYGDHRFEQTGRWTSLMGAMKHVYLAVGLISAGSFATALSDEPIWLVATGMGMLWLPLGLAYWKAESFRRLTEGKRLGEMGFRCKPRPGRVFGIYLGGWFAMSGIFSGVFFVFGMVVGLLALLVDPTIFIEDNVLDLPAWVFPLVGLVLYFAMFLLGGVLRQVFITLPLARYFSEVTVITGAEGLGAVHQRARDEFAEAEGFADALPLGDGI